MSDRAAAPEDVVRQLERLVSSDLDPAHRRRQRVLLGWLASAGGGPMLDLGCGRGFSLRLAAAAGLGEVVGLEPDPRRLLEARQAGPAPLVRGEGQRLPFGSGSFTRALVCEVLEHVEQEAALLAEVRRVLRPGGWLALSVPHAAYPASYDPPNALLERLGAPPIRRGPLAGIWTDHRRLYEPEKLGVGVRAAGFEIVELRRLTRATLPFLHLGIYELGKRLLSVAPAALAVQLDRSRPGAPQPAALRPLRELVDRIDAGSDDRGEAPGVRTVNLAVLARARS